METNYEQKPKIKINQPSDASMSYEEIFNNLGNVTLIETYPGVRANEIIDAFRQLDPKVNIVSTLDFATHDKHSFRTAILDDLSEDRVFGKLSEKNYVDFFDKRKIHDFVKSLDTKHKTFIIGLCAHLFALPDAKLIYADMPRWEIQLRYRNKEGVYFGGGIEDETLKNFKRGYFIEWRMADRIKKSIWGKIDFFLDTTIQNKPIMIKSSLMKQALHQTSLKPFRLVPYFDAGVWGGHWMSDKLGLGQNKHSKWAWGFDGVPEENSLMFEFDDQVVFEIPAINLVFFESKKLLGPRVWNRFGEELPIRFDFLDTIGGQNLSLQVHPTTQYIRDNFRMPYTQEESYYILDVDESETPTCYLGLKDGVKKEDLFLALQKAQETNEIDVEKYVNRFAVKKHDHLHHPAGCIHSSASGCMVLEISATPYIFTFKLWDWGRVDFDGKPRPINLEHGQQVVQEEFTTEKCLKECVSPFATIEQEPGVKVERTGLHPTQFIETRRYTISDKKGFVIDCSNSVNMLNLIAGKSAIIESLNNEFEPLEVHYAETFIVPESCQRFVVKPLDCDEIMLLQAFVRTSA